MSALHSDSSSCSNPFDFIAPPDDTRYLDHDTARLYSPSDNRLSSFPLLEICLNQFNFFIETSITYTI
ncbi:hypothetical protein Hanom_Chr12g01167071 [Helianthus anomalus]